MSGRNRAFLAALLIACLLVIPAADTGKEIRILFVGNSYTFYNNMPGIGEALYEGAGLGQMKTAMFVRGGMSLFHVAGDLKAEFVEILQRGWDIVVLQEQSTLGGRGSMNGRPVIGDPRRFHQAVRALHAEISKRGAKTALLLTWAREHAPETQPALDAAYAAIAEELAATLIPAGPAWQKAREEGIGGLYSPDRSHPSLKGSYLTACVVLTALFGELPEKAPYAVTVAAIEDSRNGFVLIGNDSREIRVDANISRKMQEIAHHIAMEEIQ